MIHDRKLLVFGIGLVIACSLVLVTFIGAQPSGELYIPDSDLWRVLPDPQPDRYWILNRGNGLVLLEKTPGGTWFTTTYDIGDVRDFAGPDSNGMFYCTFGGNPAGIYVFNSATASVDRTIALSRYPRGLVLSPDETKLYVCVFEWPLLGERGEHADCYTTKEHREAGRVFEIDIQTGEVLRQATVGTLPEMICYFDGEMDDRLLVSTRDYYPVIDELSGIGLGAVGKLDIVDLRSFTRLEPRIEVGHPNIEYENDLFNWPWNDSLVAQCCSGVGFIYGYEHMDDAIWLIDPITNTVADTIHVTDEEGWVVGVKHAFPSQCYPDRLYVSVGMAPKDYPYAVLAVDRTSGQWIRSFDTENWVTEFLYETPDNELIAPCGGSGRILILDTSE